MVVRIRFRRGPRVERRKGKNSRVAWVAAALFTLGSVSCLVLGLWRLGVDFGWTNDFIIQSGFLSHWQIWIGATAGFLYLNRQLQLTRPVADSE